MVINILYINMLYNMTGGGDFRKFYVLLLTILTVNLMKQAEMSRSLFLVPSGSDNSITIK